MFKQVNNCQICQSKGNEILSLKYEHLDLINFFNSYYGIDRSKSIKKMIKDYDYTLLDCSNCEFIWQLNQPNEILSFELYENLIDRDQSYEKSIQVLKNSKRRFVLEAKYLKNFFNNREINILDYGAGWGSWLIAIKDVSRNLFATEMSIERINHLNLNNIKIVNLKDLKNYKNFFDVIRIEQVLEHVGDINSLINNLSYVLKTSGLICIGVPDGNSIIKTKKVKIEKSATQPLEHLNCFNNKSLKKLMKKHGFRNIKIRELIYSHLKDESLSLKKIKFLLSDLRTNLFSTSIKFIKV